MFAEVERVGRSGGGDGGELGCSSNSSGTDGWPSARKSCGTSRGRRYLLSWAQLVYNAACAHAILC